MRKRKISNGPQQMDCSDGAKMLIDQMKEHPEEFRGYAGKFRDILDTAMEVTRGNPRHMSQRDAVAIMAAAKEHLYEVWLAEDVLTKIMAPEPELHADMAVTIGNRAKGKSVLQGQTAAVSPALGIGTTLAQYAQESQMSLAKQRVELAEQRRHAEEYAMRDTTPIRSFI